MNTRLRKVPEGALLVTGAILFGIFVVPRLAGREGGPTVGSGAADLKSLRLGIVAYQSDNHALPSSLQDLLMRPRDLRTWKGPYLDGRELPKDPWGRDYQYQVPGARPSAEFALWSAGPDGIDGTADDVTLP